jgi:hypothetical protein
MAPTPAAIRHRAGSADPAGGREAAAVTVISHEATTTWRPSGQRWVGPCDGLGSPDAQRTAGPGSDRQAIGGLMRYRPGKRVPFKRKTRPKAVRAKQSQLGKEFQVLRRAKPWSGLQTSDFTLQTRPKAVRAKRSQFGIFRSARWTRRPPAYTGHIPVRRRLVGGERGAEKKPASLLAGGRTRRTRNARPPWCVARCTCE